MSQEGKYLLASKPERGSITGDPWDQAQSRKKKLGQAELAGALGSHHGVDCLGLTGALDRRQTVDNVEPYYATWNLCGLSMGREWWATWNLNTLCGTYGGYQWDANGRQHGPSTR